MKETIKLLLVDDHEVVRMGLRSLLTMIPHIEIIGEAANGNQAISQALEKKPDIILLDIRMPDKSGIDVCRELKTLLPKTRLLMLTSYGSRDLVQDAMAAGASGYVLKEISAEGLIESIESVMKGKLMLDPTITSNLVNEIQETTKEEKMLAHLTQLEKQILKYLSYGKTNKEIAKDMNFSEKTVRNYISIILEKLQVHNRVEAAAFAIRHQFDS